MRRVVLALLVLAVAAALPAQAAAQGCGRAPAPAGASPFPNGDVPPDIEQYAPDFGEQQRSARGAPCGGSPAGGGTTQGANEQVQGVPAPPAAGGGPPAPGPQFGERVDKPPVPTPAKRVKLADVAAPAVTARPGGPDVPTWALILMAVALGLALVAGAVHFTGADLSRFTRPLGAAAGEARARSSDRAIELWETVRFGR